MLFFPAIRIPKKDWAHLMQLAFDAEHNGHPAAAFLRSEVHRAIVVDELKGVDEVVQLNTCVKYQVDKRILGDRVLVHPEDYNTSELHLSVLTSLGAALVGVRVGDGMPFLCTEGNLHLVTPLAVGPKLGKSTLPKKIHASAGQAFCCDPITNRSAGPNGSFQQISTVH